MNRCNRSLVAALAIAVGNFLTSVATAADIRELRGTRPLTLSGDISETMIAGVDRFLLRETEASVLARADYWRRDVSSPAAYVASVEPNRARLAQMLGLRDERLKFVGRRWSAGGMASTFSRCGGRSSRA